MFGDFGQFACAFLEFVEVVFGAGDALGVFGVLALFVAVQVAETIDFLLVTATFFFELLEFEAGVVDVLAEGEGMVAFGLALTLVAENFGLATSDLVTEGSDLDLHVVVASTLIVEVVASIVAFFLQSVQGDTVRVLSSLKLVFLEELLVLEVSVLGLDAVELVTKSTVVLIALLNFKDFGFQLTNQKIFLVTCQMHAVIVSCHLSCVC